jgi:hypothetical protein
MNMIINVVVCRVVGRNKIKLDQNVMVGQNWGFVCLGLCVPIDELCELFFMHFVHSFTSSGIVVKSFLSDTSSQIFFYSWLISNFFAILLKTALNVS